MKLRFPLQVKFISLIVLVLILIFGVITVVRVQQNRQLLRAELMERTNTFATLASENIVNTYQQSGANGSSLNATITQLLLVDKNITGIALLNSANQVLYSKGLVSAIPQNSSTRIVNQPDGDLKALVYSVTNKDAYPVKAIAYQVSNASIQTAIAKQIGSIILFSIIGTVVSAVVLFILVDRSVIQPIRKLSRKAELVSAGDYSDDNLVASHDEIGDLLKSIDIMESSLRDSVQRLNDLDNAKSEFMMIASHTLRTPITIIKSSLEAIESMPVDEPTKNMLKLADAGTQRLSTFAEDLLMVSNLEVGQQVIQLKPLVMDGVFDLFITYFQTQADQKNVHLNTSLYIDKGVELNANRPYLMNAISNIMDNAIKFSSNNGLIDLIVKSTADSLIIEINDNGIGIHEAEMDKIFQKLHRGTSTEQYDFEGSGIGLYVTKKIIDAHQGTIDVASQLGHGSKFTITLPLLKKPGQSPALA